MSALQAWALRLNRRQTRALVLGLVLAILIAINPYWYFLRVNEVGGKKRVPAGFHYVGSPPMMSNEYFRTEVHIDWTIWIMMEAVCLGVTIAVISALRDKNTEANATFGQYR